MLLDFNQSHCMETEQGASGHYQGEAGSRYFAYQNSLSHIGGQIDARKFTELVLPQHKVLDFGCGGGWILGHIDCKQRVGVEINSHAHASCESNGIKVYKDASLVEERDFDRIITHHCLEHVPHPVQALKSLCKLLGKDGRVIIVLPLDDWRVQRNYQGRDINHHLHTWTPRLLANTLIEAGFEVEQIKVLTHAWFPGWHKLFGKLPDFAFDALCTFWGAVMKRRQLLAVARLPLK